MNIEKRFGSSPSYIYLSSFKFGMRYSYAIQRLHFCRMQKGLSELALSSSPGCFDYAKKFRTDSRGRAGIFGETSTRIRPKVPNYLRNTIPGKFLRRNSELGVTRFEGIAFERRRKYRFPKAVLRFSLAPPSCFPCSIVSTSKWRCFYLTSERNVSSYRTNGPASSTQTGALRRRDGSFLRIISNQNLE